jgi:hypothetical protein
VAAAALVVLAEQLVATCVALAVNLPSQFGGVGEDATPEFVSRGTAISAPVLPLVLLAIAALLALRRDRWGVVGTVAICVLSAFFVIGSLGEAVAEPTPDVSSTVLVAFGLLGAALGVTLLSLGVLELRRRRRLSRVPA